MSGTGQAAPESGNGAEFVAGGVHVGLTVEAGAWPRPDALRDATARVLKAAILALDLQPPDGCELGITFTDDASIRLLNRQWRGKDKATNVLSFPTVQIAVDDPLPPLLGDIVLAAESLAREAAQDGKTFDHHLAHLLLHGFLHLVGYDHEDDEEAEAMEAAERAILARLAIRDPYA